MTVTDVQKDFDALTLTITSEFDAPVDRVWAVWQDPRLLERWWGPPTHPATFIEYDLVPGGRAKYYMTSPEGDRYWGWWEITTVDAPRSIEIRDGFGDDKGEPNLDLPAGLMRVDLTDRAGGGATMSIKSTHATIEDLQQVLSMGQEEGMTLALNQIDELLSLPA